MVKAVIPLKHHVQTVDVEYHTEKLLCLMMSNNIQDATDASLPIFKVERVQLQFSIASDFVAAQVANNVLVLALSTGRILRIDLDNPGDIDGSLLFQPFMPMTPNIPSALRH